MWRARPDPDELQTRVGGLDPQRAYTRGEVMELFGLSRSRLRSLERQLKIDCRLAHGLVLVMPGTEVRRIYEWITRPEAVVRREQTEVGMRARGLL